MGHLSLTNVVLLFVFTFSSVNANSLLSNIGLSPDTAINRVSGDFKRKSHVKLFLPNLPYLAISHAVNASLVRPANNLKGWQYDIATSHSNIDDKIWQFSLRKNVIFQDGTKFDADSVIQNMEYFKKDPFLFSKLPKILKKIEKIDQYTVRFYLSEPYSVFLHDAMWLQFYTTKYLEKFGWNGKPNCPNLAEAGPYGLGPYILKEGYIEGHRSSKKVILVANPNYWGDNKAKVEKFTIYTNLKIENATKKVLFSESEIDISPTPFENIIDTIYSPYAKLLSSPSNNSYAMHFNLINGNPALQNSRIRYIINQAIDQDFLRNLSMLGEATKSPTLVSPSFYKVAEAIEALKPYLKTQERNKPSISQLKQEVKQYLKDNDQDPDKPLTLTLIAQESFNFLINDLKYFLSQVNISLETNIVSAEKEVFQHLFYVRKNKNKKSSDLILWGNFDWFKHPCSVFFAYKPLNDWSTIPANKNLSEFIEKILKTNINSKEYVSLLTEYIKYIYDTNYMVFFPNPNNVYAVNKEVLFKSGRSAFVYLRDIQVTPLHWSIRKTRPYPELSKQSKIYVNEGFQQ